MWVLSALIGFILTNFDTFLIMLMLQSYGLSPSRQRVVLLGFVLGLLLLVGLALLGLNLTQLLIQSHLNVLFALVFILMAGFTLFRKDENSSIRKDALYHSSIKLLLMMLSISLVSGTDNIIVYMGLFSTLRTSSYVFVIVLHIGLITMFYALSRYMATYPNIQAYLSRHQQRIIAGLLIYLAMILLFI